MSPITIEVPGLPVAFARSGGNGKVRFTPKKQRGAMADLKLFAANAMRGREPFRGPLAAFMAFTWPMPASWPKRRREAPESRWRTSRPDADNLCKLVLDSLNGIVFTDDAIVAHVAISKLYGPSASTSITINPLSAEAEARSSAPPDLVVLE
jgi:Holliday junction resolvase RusA-like endonuclease